MTATSQFHSVLRESAADDPAALPGHVALAAADALGADGASFNVLVRELRVPLGASDMDAARAESLQFTEGVGPCMEAMITQSIVAADAARMTSEWAGLWRRWQSETAYRSAVSAPIPLDGVQSTVDFYFRDADAATGVDRARLVEVVLLVAEQFAYDLRAGPEGPLTTARARVWVALGMLVAARSIGPDDALNLLRGYAIAHHTVLDEVAWGLIAGGIDPDDIAA